MLGIKVVSGFTTIFILLSAGYQYLSTKSGTISNVLTKEGYEFIEKLPKDLQQKKYEDSFRRNKEYILAKKDFLKGTKYELMNFENDEEGGAALNYWCKEVQNKPFVASNSSQLVYASQLCTLNFETKLEFEGVAEKLRWNNSSIQEEWKESLEEISNIAEFMIFASEEEIMEWCNSKRTNVFNNVSESDYEDAKIICGIVTEEN